MEYVYATRRHPECKGRRFINAKFFNGPKPDATRVYVEHGFPRIVEAYRAAGIPVRTIGRKSRSAVPAPPEGLVARIIAER